MRAQKKPKRLRHNRRHGPSWGSDDYVQLKKSGGTIDDALRLALERWGVTSTNLTAKITVAKLRKRWQKWDEADRWHFLTVVEAVADTEVAKSAEARKVKASRFGRLRKLGMDAVSLADDVLRVFPPPWDVETQSAAEFVRVVASFSVGAYIATGISDKTRFQPIADAGIEFFRLQNPSVDFWELLAEVSSVAAGRRVRSQSLRRYHQKGSLKAPGQGRWKQRAGELDRVRPYLDPKSIAQFQEICSRFLMART